jgi:fermentation-respiration switch protein FrsA (DUF1100 family)
MLVMMRNTRRVTFCLCAMLCAITAPSAPAPSSKVTIRLRGVEQTLYYFPPQAPQSQDVAAVVLCGDGGWHGFIGDIAAHLAELGYPTFGVDSKDYLESLSKPKALEPAQVTSDLGDFIRFALDRTGKKYAVLVGWSEGAGLGILGGLNPAVRTSLHGVVAVGLPERNELAWRTSDAIIYLTKKVPNEPTFNSQDYVAKLSPLPLVMIQSTHDDFVPVEAANRIFARGQEPKRIFFIEARNHRFEGAQAEFFQALDRALEWFRDLAAVPSR